MKAKLFDSPILNNSQEAVRNLGLYWLVLNKVSHLQKDQ